MKSKSLFIALTLYNLLCINLQASDTQQRSSYKRTIVTTLLFLVTITTGISQTTYDNCKTDFSVCMGEWKHDEPIGAKIHELREATEIFHQMMPYRLHSDKNNHPSNLQSLRGVPLEDLQTASARVNELDKQFGTRLKHCSDLYKKCHMRAEYDTI